MNRNGFSIPETNYENKKMKATFCVLLKAWLDVNWSGRDMDRQVMEAIDNGEI